MIVTVNGIEKKLKAGATLKDAIRGAKHVKGTVVAIHKSTDTLKVDSDDFEVLTSKGTFRIHLSGSEHSAIWRGMVDAIKGSTARWSTHDIAAFGSFPTELPTDRSETMYRRYDCFFSLGGFDNHTTYMMVAKDDHRRSYGAGSQLIGRVTRGRHVIDDLKEMDEIISIEPVVSETFTENYELTTDPECPLEDGNRIETFVKVNLDTGSPASAEHLIVMSQNGSVTATHDTGSYIASDDDMDIVLESEAKGVREVGSVYVRSTGVGTGRMFFYKERRQMSESFNHVGDVENGRSIMASIGEGQRFTLVTEPQRVLTVGMTMAEGRRILAEKGIEAVCKGDASDDSIIADQSPERTVDVLNKGRAELLGVRREDIYRISLDDDQASDVHYFRKLTGLNHKPVGTMNVHFWFPGMSMATFEGDEVKGKSLYPGKQFKKCKRGDIGLTNQACDHHGLLGIRMEDSKSFGPTGEEPFGTNIFGRFLGDLDRFAESLDEGKTVYITEMKL